jgi:hypothetical protein
VDTLHGSVTLPVFQGRVNGKLVWYIVTESSDRADAARRGVTWAPRLAALATSDAAQPGAMVNGELRYRSGITFTAGRVVRPQPDSGFPALEASPGSVGDPGYTPFVRLLNGVVLNAPIVADEYHTIDRVITLDIGRGRVTLRLARGYGSARHVWYISTDASDPMVAAFERSTWAPAMAATPKVAESGAGSARFGILAIANGVTDRTSPERQGMQSALKDGLSPLNILQAAPLPGDSSYTPAWDLHLAMWTSSAVSQDQRVKIITWQEAKAYAERGLLVTAMPGTANPLLGGLEAAGVVVNCPVMASFPREP